MYGNVGFKSGVIGDVDVLKVGDTYHLFHLVLPNHSYIAHATSHDGLNWEAAPHALSISHPGYFDDAMLWTMHVTPDPDHAGRYRMFYTGLNRADRAQVQRIGLAVSDDLIHWEKQHIRNGCPAYPLDPRGRWYENERPDNRLWRSFRDPYFYEDPNTGARWMLACGRVGHGPMVRRGCVVTAKEVARDQWEFVEPLHHPGLYDEFECPAVIAIDGRYYLMGSIREDVKVRYWVADQIEGPYENFFDNTLLPQGNYAARPGFGPDGLLLWNFYYRGEVGGPNQFMPPPKKLAVDERGQLRLQSFSGFDGVVTRTLRGDDLCPLEPERHNPHAATPPRTADADGWLGCGAGFEAFLLPGEYRDLRMRARLSLQGRGKTGLVLRHDPDGNGYYISLDLVKGLAQARAWGENHVGELAEHELPPEQGFRFESLQSNHFLTAAGGPWDLQLIAYGKYLELSINGYIVLTLADETYKHGRLGFYAESSKIKVEQVSVEELHSPQSSRPVSILND
jgi:beta-fructofuranosidase